MSSVECLQCQAPGRGSAVARPDASQLGDGPGRARQAQLGACDVAPQNGDLGLGASARVIAPGNALNSVLIERMSRRDANGMPPLASNVVDANGVALIETWIDSLAICL